MGLLPCDTLYPEPQCSWLVRTTAGFEFTISFGAVIGAKLEAGIEIGLGL